MHILNRLFAVALCMTVLVPTGTFALISMQQKEDAANSLNSALEHAAKSYKYRTSLQSLQNRTEETLQEQQDKMTTIGQRQKAVREEMISLRATIAMLKERHGVKLNSVATAKALMETEKKLLGEALRVSYMKNLSKTITDADPRRNFVRMTFDARAAAPSEMDLITDAHLSYLYDLDYAAATLARLDILTQQRNDLLSERLTSAQSLASAEEKASEVESQVEEIARITADVHDQVLKMQGELARIDARLREKAQRALLEKGLIDPSQIKDQPDAPGRRPAFSWPVYGPVSAGFHNDAYKKHFGVAHEGMDIVVGQGTPVGSAADGVVFLVRDGGAKGFTYVLIGHRNGYATLYGHLSSVSVFAGQDVTAGQFIGLSGGKPGTQGAGPMTTASHLHFEVIQNGLNVDPKSVLP